MPLLAFLRQCSYWSFLAFSVAFLVISLLLQLPEPFPALSFAHPFALYGVVLSLLLSISCAVTLWICRTGDAEQPSATTLYVTLGASLLVSGMIAALLFFL